MTVDDIFAGIVKHGEDGVDFITVHCGVTRSTVERMKNEGRVMDVVSRGEPSPSSGWCATAGKTPSMKNSTGCWR